VASDWRFQVDIRRLLPLSGIVFVALLIIPVIFIGGDTPESDATASEVAAFYGDETVRQGIAAFLLAAGAPFLVFFASALAARFGLDEGHRHRPVWERVVTSGGAITAAAMVVAALIHFALSDGADQNVSPVALQALNVLDGNVWLPFNSGLGVMMLGAAGLLLTATVLPRWLGWIALVLGVALFIPFADFIALVLTLAWIIITSVMLYLAAPRDTVSGVAPT
jgi:hypothetical protein